MPLRTVLIGINLTMFEVTRRVGVLKGWLVVWLTGGRSWTITVRSSALDNAMKASYVLSKIVIVLSTIPKRTKLRKILWNKGLP